MSEEPARTSVSIMGLPSSGKTTYLAALWHLITTSEVETKLRFGSLAGGDFTYLNEILKRWRSAKEQERTQVNGMKTVVLNLVRSDGTAVRVTFPDVPGEEFARMWEDREIDPDVANTLSSGNILLFLHGDRIRAPAWVTGRTELATAIGEPPPEAEPEKWHPKHAPTQVQLVDLLQQLGEPPLAAGPRRLAVAISAWDKVEGEGLTPERFIRAKLPLLGQYLRSGRDGWEWRTYGVSAQGGVYDKLRTKAGSGPEAERLREIDIASERIRLVSTSAESHDLTEPLEWLMA